MTPATDEANAPPGTAALRPSPPVPYRALLAFLFRPSVSPALLFNVWAYLLGPFAFFLFGLWRKGIVLSPSSLFCTPTHPAHLDLRVHGHPH